MFYMERNVFAYDVYMELYACMCTWSLQMGIWDSVYELQIDEPLFPNPKYGLKGMHLKVTSLEVSMQ